MEKEQIRNSFEVIIDTALFGLQRVGMITLTDREEIYNLLKECLNSKNVVKIGGKNDK